MRAELELAGVEVGFRVAGEAVGEALVKERLLAFEDELLVAQRAHGEPREQQARQEHREHEEERDTFHGASGSIGQTGVRVERGLRARDGSGLVWHPPQRCPAPVF